MKILGRKYEIVIDPDLIEQGADGLCMKYDKQIRIRPVDKMLGADDPTQAKEKRFKEVLRHEVIHAFFIEAGLDCYSDNEELVDWIANMFPAMLKQFDKCDCLD